VKLWPRVWCLVFLTHGVYIYINDRLLLRLLSASI